jgi:hypothetical protein
MTSDPATWSTRPEYSTHGVELLGSQGAVRAGQVQERPLPGPVDEHDGRGRRHGGVAQETGRVDAALHQEPRDEVAERVVADLPHRRRAKPEPHECRRRVERAPAAAEGDLVHEPERAALGQLVHRPRDRVGDEDAEADDVVRRHRRSTTWTPRGP